MLILNGKESIFLWTFNYLKREPSIKVQWIVKLWDSLGSEAVKDYLLKIKSKSQNSSPKTNMEILSREQLI